MAAMRIVPAFNEVEDCHPRLDLGFEAATAEPFASTVAKKLSHIALSKQSPTEPHRGPHPSLATAQPERDRGALGALVRVMYHCGGVALPHCHVERLHHQFRAQMGFHRPGPRYAG
jgi:hypothetical protein